jgi:predicted chitinase
MRSFVILCVLFLLNSLLSANPRIIIQRIQRPNPTIRSHVTFPIWISSSRLCFFEGGDDQCDESDLQNPMSEPIFKSPATRLPSSRSAESRAGISNLRDQIASHEDAEPTLNQEQSKDGAPTYEQFVAASLLHPHIWDKRNAPKPSRSIYALYLRLVARKMSLPEQAMFMANVVWETLGLQLVEESACRYGNCVYGKYYGRGYIQLTWEANYREASYGIFKDDRLLRHPEIVTTPVGAWLTAVYYWMWRVRPVLQAHDAVENGHFGYSVMSINGGLECGPHATSLAARHRLHIYHQILKIWGISDDKSFGSLRGCEGSFSNIPSAAIEFSQPLNANRPNFNDITGAPSDEEKFSKLNILSDNDFTNFNGKRIVNRVARR